VDAERSRRRDGTSATWVKADDRYGGARPCKTSSSSRRRRRRQRRRKRRMRRLIYIALF